MSTRATSTVSPVQEPVRSSAATLPDMNAETNPFDIVLHLLDEAAYFPLYSMPESRDSSAILSTGSTSNAIGVRVSERLHRLKVNVQLPTRKGVHANNEIGEPLAHFRHRWMIAPEGFRGFPGQEPPPTALDPSRSQVFVMLDSHCEFANRHDGFRGFGIGRTFPTTINGQRQLLVGALGNIMDGIGKFRGLPGTYTYCGALSPDSGFQGSLLCRIMDFDSRFRTQRSLVDIQVMHSCRPDATYLLFRGQKKNKHEKTVYTFGPNGNVDGFKLVPQIRLFDLDCALDGRGHLHSTSTVGPVVGSFLSYVFFNVLNPGAPGDANSPIKFVDYDNFVFCDQDGREVGSFGFNGGATQKLGLQAGQGGEGRAFNLVLPGLPGQQALRFGGFGPLFDGKGEFKDAQGVTCHNSVVGVAPHAVATTFVARVENARQDSRQAPTYICKQSLSENSYKCEPQDE